jgi:hypothetical protein
LDRAELDVSPIIELGTPATSVANAVFSPAVLNFGFVAGLVLALLCLLSTTWYMLSFERDTTALISETLQNATRVKDANVSVLMEHALNTHAFVAHLLLLSCGVFVGMAMAFLGFSLFLIGAHGEIDAQMQGNDQFKLSVARLSPGAFAIMGAAIVIAVCATHSLSFGSDTKNPAPPNQSAGASGPGAASPGPGKSDHDI